MRQCALSAAVATATKTGRLHKGSLDLAKLEPAFRGTPVVDLTTRGFLRRSSRTEFGNHT
jgi:hypothetical protein